MSVEAMKQALDALEYIYTETTEEEDKLIHAAIASLRLAIEQAEKQEPVAYVSGYYAGRCVIEPLNRAMVMPDGMALYTAPPQRQPHELLCVCGASWSIDSEGNEELLSTPPQRQPLTRKDVLAIIDSEPAYMITGLPMFYRDQVAIIVRKVERAHGIAAAKEKS